MSIREPAEVLTWVCQHGTLRRGYVKPSASCVKRARAACEWTQKEVTTDDAD